jgi:hypothetical protein
MLFPTKAAMDRALLIRILERHEAKVIGKDDREFAANADNGEDPTNLTMIYSMLTDCHRQLVIISRGLWLLAALGLFVIFRMVG